MQLTDPLVLIALISVSVAAFTVNLYVLATVRRKIEVAVRAINEATKTAIGQVKTAVEATKAATMTEVKTAAEATKAVTIGEVKAAAEATKAATLTEVKAAAEATKTATIGEVKTAIGEVSEEILKLQKLLGQFPEEADINKLLDALVARKQLSEQKRGEIVALRTAAKRDDRRSRWALEPQGRRGANVAAVALANKNARTAWALLAGEADFDADHVGKAA